MKTELREIAEKFRTWVTDELTQLSQEERENLRGDYLFRVDGEPRFVVVVEPFGAWSGSLDVVSGRAQVSLNAGCPIQYNETTLAALLDGAARSTVLTDSVTLERLLQGTLRASVSFVSGRVKILGDLAAFMRLVSCLKRKGVRPLGETPETL